MNQSEFKTSLMRMASDVENALEKFCAERDNPQKNIYKAMRYSLLCGGKRIRPVLALAVADVLGVRRDTVMPFACALEMIHTYSLIHDDLPSMDDDELRRGRLTCHKQFDEATAILAGDSLLNKAFELMSCAALHMDNPVYGLRIIADVSYLSGTEGMIGGQVTDLESEGKAVSEEILKHTYSCKTGALLKAPVYIAAEAGGFRISANTLDGEFYEKYPAAESFDENVQKLLRYSEIIGTAFQIKDDILDVEGDTELLGKPVGSDAQEDKSTYVTLYGIDRCKEILHEMTEEAKCIADSFGEKGDFLREMAVYLLERNN
ncbi:MAG: polyprenyl synthetase family protein [Ruminococcaceae bacterium]|nr:polyprenyl synthetase family protein [Oscillospiraceae bacterium]